MPGKGPAPQAAFLDKMECLSDCQASAHWRPTLNLHFSSQLVSPMLKALELVGFKSFADKTRFEFPRGITVVVGPNGSGKSNIVDAIKWVLGEQSVKSLRGKEMADVIFNGSASRRPLNAAEATLTFDNSQRLLAVDTPEVHITRRVYRSGEGEYLINRQPCRLRDIRDLFAGTGVATEAYSVIEQGKVDVLLQSSPRDRRLIFEEAAGISRFKAKKVEAQRRLERVEQNLLRLSDIVDEVESRLRSVRLQAGKARRYKEYSDRLQELRTQIGLADWRTLIRAAERGWKPSLAVARGENARAWPQAEALEAQALALGRARSRLPTRPCAPAKAASRRIASGSPPTNRPSSTSGAACRDLEEEIARYRRQLTSMSCAPATSSQQLREIVAQPGVGRARHREVARRLAEEERGLTKLTAQVDELRAENEQRRAAHLEQLRAVAALEQSDQRTGSRRSRPTAIGAASAARKRLAELISATATHWQSTSSSCARMPTSLAIDSGRRQAELEQAQAQLAETRRQAARVARRARPTAATT